MQILEIFIMKMEVFVMIILKKVAEYGLFQKYLKTIMGNMSWQQKHRMLMILG